MDTYRYQDFDEFEMTRSIRDHGELEIRLSPSQSKVFDHLLSRYLKKDSSDAETRNGLAPFIQLFSRLVNEYQRLFNYPKLGVFDFVFESGKPLHCRRSENAGEVLYVFRKKT